VSFDLPGCAWSKAAIDAIWVEVCAEFSMTLLDPLEKEIEVELEKRPGHRGRPGGSQKRTERSVRPGLVEHLAAVHAPRLVTVPARLCEPRVSTRGPRGGICSPSVLTVSGTPWQPCWAGRRCLCSQCPGCSVTLPGDERRLLARVRGDRRAVSMVAGMLRPD
jgi:hypothetical protein